MNRSSALLSHLNEAVLPIYVLHQPIMLVTAFWLFPLRLPLPIEVLLLVEATGLGSILIYEAGIRPFALTRFLFGLKPRAVPYRPASGQTQAISCGPARSTMADSGAPSRQ